MTELPPALPPNSLPYATPSYDRDAEHLRLLAIFHWIVGPLQLLMALFPIMHVVMGVMMLNGKFGPPQSSNQPDASFIGWFFIIMGSTFILTGSVFGVLTLVSGFELKNRRRRMFSIVVAGLNCIHFPFGTTLGVFTLIVLLRRSVEELYRSTART